MKKGSNVTAWTGLVSLAACEPIRNEPPGAKTIPRGAGIWLGVAVLASVGGGVSVAGGRGVLVGTGPGGVEDGCAITSVVVAAAVAKLSVGVADTPPPVRKL
jgi:hypothetical protein